MTRLSLFSSTPHPFLSPSATSVVIDNGAAGPSPGDVVIASGNVFASLAPGAAPVGQFDYYSTTTSIAGSWERRFVATEVSLFLGTSPSKRPPSRRRP